MSKKIISAKPSEGTESEVATIDKAKTQTPKQFKVFLLNDDYTTMDFVVHILETVFMKSPAEAVQVMLQVHKLGKGVAGIFAKQIAEAKVQLVHQRAKTDGYPLKCVMEEA
jgi:ATP-dependent Clp protease adaptor protein ClpS